MMTRPFRFIDAFGFRRVVGTVTILSALILSTAATALVPTRALTQSLHRIWQLQQGLPQATIYRIRQSSDGYLWLGTQTGLVRFDGIRFVSVDEIGGVSLHNVWVHDLIEDARHQMWIATDEAGLIRAGDNKAEQFGPKQGLASLTVQSVMIDSIGAIWACTPKGISKYEQGIFTTYTAAQGLHTDDVHTACQAADGAIWIGGAGPALTVRRKDAFHVIQLKHLPSTAIVQSLLATADGTIWVGSTTGLLRYKDGEEHLVTEAEGLTGNVIFCLEQGRDGCVWVGTQNGFSRIRNTEIDSFRPEDGLSQSTVHTLCEDLEGSLWAGTKHGLDQFIDRRTVPFTTSEGLPSNDTGPIQDGGSDGLWIGTVGAGLSRFDGKHFTVLTKAQGLVDNSILALAMDGQKNLWVGTDSGLAEIRNRQVVRVLTTADGLPANKIASLAVDPSNALWIATDAGVAVLHDDKISRVDNRSAKTVFVRHDGSVLAAFADGPICVVHGNTFQPLAGAETIHDASCFHEDADGTLWIGTRGGGLAVLRGNQLSKLLVRDGLYDDDLFAILADDEDKLWFACSKGIFNVARSQLRDFAAGKLAAVTSTPFSPTDGLRTIECKSDVQPAAARTHDGKLWFSTIHGAILIDPAHFQRRGPPPRVLVEEVVIDGKPHAPARVHDLAPGTMNLEFSYTALSFLIPTRTTFHYKLEGFDKDWVDAGTRRQAFYTYLPPGKYQFKVIASVPDGPSAEATNPVAFRLEPHFYQRAFFVPLLVLAAAALVSLYYLRRLRAVRANTRIILAERSRIARELHDTLMQGFSGVTMEMQALSSRLEEPQHRTSLDEIIRDAGTCLREARQSVAGLRTGTGPASGLGASLTLAARQAVEGHEIRLKLGVIAPPTQLAPEVDYNLLNIAKEAMTNAINHSGCRSIEVSLETTASSLLLLVKDDGSGITAPAGPGHYGMVGMKERAAQIGAAIEFDSKPNRGTSVRVALPLPASPAPSETEGTLAVS